MLHSTHTKIILACHIMVQLELDSVGLDVARSGLGFIECVCSRISAGGYIYSTRGAFEKVTLTMIESPRLPNPVSPRYDLRSTALCVVSRFYHYFVYPFYDCFVYRFHD